MKFTICVAVCSTAFKSFCRKGLPVNHTVGEKNMWRYITNKCTNPLFFPTLALAPCVHTPTQLSQDRPTSFKFSIEFIKNISPCAGFPQAIFAHSGQIQVVGRSLRCRSTHLIAMKKIPTLILSVASVVMSVIQWLMVLSNSEICAILLAKLFPNIV